MMTTPDLMLLLLVGEISIPACVSTIQELLHYSDLRLGLEFDCN